jgi:excisionase family DNA binding protein
VSSQGRKGCKHFELAADGALRLCPIDHRKLWPKPIVRQIRFHSLRHSTASLLIMAGANPAAVRRIMRHSDPKMTDIYTHLAPDYLRAEVDRLSFAPPTEPVPAEALAQVVNAEESVPFWSPSSDEGDNSARTRVANIATSEEKTKRSRRDSNARPLASEAASGIVHPLSTVPFSSESVRLNEGARVQPSQGLAGVLKNCVPLWSPKLRVLEGGAEHLLLVREVAERLRVSTATIYKLIDTGALPHLRVSNAIRVVPADVKAFVEAQRSSPNPASRSK